ncbi:hypothetical protein HOLleu_25012 [Holothuria leucospilota]|uniref:Uncharacterized protein n=1 Tax=Holothuria leucospilota TaxID=206669 RepID=A0A9Q1H360_HOLLE|nr:hypothetical protein HOLleu_25012 [Holothuria leucospilota]
MVCVSKNLQKDFKIRLSALKVNIAKNLGCEEALRLSLMFNLINADERKIQCSKNPAVELIDVLLEGDEMIVLYKLSELERVSKQNNMNEVNELLNKFFTNHFRESFLMKISVLKNGELAKEEQSLLSEMLWDSSQFRTISDLDVFFKENYGTTISSVQEGSLLLRIKMPTEIFVNKLWTDLRSGKLATTFFPILRKSITRKCSHENPLGLKVVFDKTFHVLKDWLTENDCGRNETDAFDQLWSKHRNTIKLQAIAA